MLKIQTARKDHKCDECEKIIPKGVLYWRDYQEDELGNTISGHKEHTNCLLFVNEEAA